MAGNNVFYAQSGGATAVINASACGVIETARKHSDQLGKVYVGRNGILGALREELIDTSQESPEAISALRYTPSSAFGSCRYKLKGLEENRAEYERLIEVFQTHNIGYFFYNGGGDSQDTSHKVSQMAQKMGVPLTCIGIPKTVDNDLPFTDNSPGFGSVAKYVAVSILEAGLDVAGMAATSTKVFIMEVMGRHTGWIAASAGLASEKENEPPHIILFPEVHFNPEHFLLRVDECVKSYGYCVIAVSEGVRNQEGQFLAESGLRDAFGHAQLGGVAPTIAQLIKSSLGYKYHWAVADYLQRAARHIASKTDVEQAYALGQAAVEEALKGTNGVMLTLERISDTPYQWKIGTAPLEKVANVEKGLPREFISENGMHITPECRRYLQPLILGEDYPPYRNGVPDYVRLKNSLIGKKLESLFSMGG
ncbi:MAG: 6-phosphofructokinase [Gammaproteobacteria bacterium]|nr:6-phosphofructokinase [Gammaproteobacteria bacterium]